MQFLHFWQIVIPHYIRDQFNSHIYFIMKIARRQAPRHATCRRESGFGFEANCLAKTEVVIPEVRIAAAEPDLAVVRKAVAVRNITNGECVLRKRCPCSRIKKLFLNLVTQTCPDAVTTKVQWCGLSTSKPVLGELRRQSHRRQGWLHGPLGKIQTGRTRPGTGILHHIYQFVRCDQLSGNENLVHHFPICETWFKNG